MKERKTFLILLVIFLAAYFIPFSKLNIQNAIMEAFFLLQEYARQHVILCLIPAFFIAGAISIFIRKESVIKLLGLHSNKILAYSIASVSGTILAVCSCTILPLFAGIYSRGAGIGPATTFLYSGPAINVLAIVLTAKVLGFKIGLARALGAITFSVAIGLLMSMFFKKEKEENQNQDDFLSKEEPKESRPLGKMALYFAAMIGILVFLNWAKADRSVQAWYFIYRIKWFLSGALLLAFVTMLVKWFKKEELKEWVLSTGYLPSRFFLFCLEEFLWLAFCSVGPDMKGSFPANGLPNLSEATA